MPPKSAKKKKKRKIAPRKFDMTPTNAIPYRTFQRGSSSKYAQQPLETPGFFVACLLHRFVGLLLRSAPDAVLLNAHYMVLLSTRKRYTFIMHHISGWMR